MYDLAIIGAGWSGFSAAIEARKKGLKVALIEKDKIGGTCLNYGCIPTKAFVYSTRILSLIKKAANFGIKLENQEVNFYKILERKSQVIDSLSKGMQFLIKTNQIDYLEAEAKLISPNKISLDGQKEIETKFILLATGSQPIELNSLKFDGKKIIHSNQVLELESLPRNLLIVGGGVIGCEFAQIFSKLGVNVTVVELLEQLLPNEDKEVAKKLEVVFKKNKINVLTKTDVNTVNLANFDKILVCVGRTPNSANLGLEKIGVKLEKNKILVDEYLKTSVPNIFASGDCIGGIMLAHVASYEGRLAVENMVSNCNQKADYRAIPNAIFTDPEIASIGLTEEKANYAGHEIKISKFNFLASGMAKIKDETEGFIKIISDKNSQDILGTVILGPEACELINIISLAMQAKLKLNALSKTIFAHPSISEAIIEAAGEL